MRESYNPNVLTIIKKGITAAIGIAILVLRIQKSKFCFPLKLYLEKAYAAGAPKTIEKVVLEKATIKLFIRF